MTMEILPILRALRRNKVGAILVALQIALTLAVIANGMSIIQGHLAIMGTATGMDEANIFTFQNHWVGQPENLRASIDADMAALRSQPGVVDAEATDSFPLLGGGWSWGIRLKPDPNTGAATGTTLYFQDTHGIDAMGLKLVGGRWFTSAEIGEWHMNDLKGTPSAVLTKALAKKLFPKGNPVGQIMYLFDTSPVRVVGIVDRAQTPWPAQSFGQEFAEFATFLPFQFVNNGLSYIVRTEPGQRAAVMRATPDRLNRITRQRVIDELYPFGETRKRAYQIQQSESWLLGTVCGLLLAITGFGTVGLTMYWVSRRRRQIGMRRALGARRVDILRYFHLENLLIAGTGAILGVAGGLGANLWMATHMGTTRMSPMYIGIGAVIVLVLSQLAVLWPALRAASIAPSLATRGL
jgi:putative ABC transport system permease protein